MSIEHNHGSKEESYEVEHDTKKSSSVAGVAAKVALAIAAALPAGFIGMNALQSREAKQEAQEEHRREIRKEFLGIVRAQVLEVRDAMLNSGELPEGVLPEDLQDEQVIEYVVLYLHNAHCWKHEIVQNTFYIEPYDVLRVVEKPSRAKTLPQELQLRFKYRNDLKEIVANIPYIQEELIYTIRGKKKGFIEFPYKVCPRRGRKSYVYDPLR